MARAPRNSNLTSRRLRSSPSTVPSYYKKVKKAAKENEFQSTSEEKDWKHATCPICLERPHDAVLLLCSSHSKGCRPYMCGTNYHQSNCLEQFKNAYLKEKPAHEVSPAVAAASKIPKDFELACPICRGEVKGWTLVEPARQFLNRKKRTCIHEDCSFIGSYKKLCKHVEAKHPSSKPREVDPARLAEWKELESKKERQDAISIVTGLNPGFIIRGDYLIDPNGGSSDLDMGYSDWSDSSDSFLICDDDDDDYDDIDDDDDDEEEEEDEDEDDDIILPEGAGIRALRRAVRRAYSRKNAARARQHVRIVGVRSSGIPRSGLTISRSSGRRRGVTNHRKVRVGSAWRRARSTNDS